MFGVLNLKKPTDVTSRDVVNIAQRIVKPVKVGHAGTLDPMATGVLLVCLGGATRLISLLQKSTKAYVAEFTLGLRSDTDDSTGEVEAVAVTSPPDEHAVKSALATFVGCIDQVPPAFSAVKVAGQRAYSKARRGEDVVLTPKKVMVHSIDIIRFDWPKLTLQVKCGSGTYIRSIARDLGERLGCGGLMSALERTRIGSFHVNDGIDAKLLTTDNIAESVHDPIQIVSGCSQYRCTADDVEQLKSGRRVTVQADRLFTSDDQTDEMTALTCLHGKQLLAMAEQLERGTVLQPRMVFAR